MHKRTQDSEYAVSTHMSSDDGDSESLDLVSATGVVCRTTAEGEVICWKASALQEAPVDQSAMDAIFSVLQKAFPGEWSDEKLRLAYFLLKAVADSRLEDPSSIGRRSGQTVDAVRYLLGDSPPSTLHFNYSSEAGNVLGAYLLNKGDLIGMHRVLRYFARPGKP